MKKIRVTHYNSDDDYFVRLFFKQKIIMLYIVHIITHSPGIKKYWAVLQKKIRDAHKIQTWFKTFLSLLIIIVYKIPVNNFIRILTDTHPTRLDLRLWFSPLFV